MDNDAIVVSPETSEAGRMYGESIRLSLAGERSVFPIQPGGPRLYETPPRPTL
jgi:hypothetical protein